MPSAQSLRTPCGKRRQSQSKKGACRRKREDSKERMTLRLRVDWQPPAVCRSPNFIHRGLARDASPSCKSTTSENTRLSRILNPAQHRLKKLSVQVTTMLQIIGIVIGCIAVAMGVAGLRKGEMTLTRNKPLTGDQATIAASLTILLGVVVALFMLIGIPMIMRR